MIAVSGLDMAAWDALGKGRATRRFAFCSAVRSGP